MKSFVFLGHKLKALRESKGLTMLDIEEMTGIKQSSQSDIENGRNKNPRPATVDRLCVALGVEPIYFYFDGANVGDLFPKDIPPEVRNFVFDVANVRYVKLAMQIKELGIPIEAAENIISSFGMALNIRQVP